MRPDRIVPARQDAARSQVDLGFLRLGDLQTSLIHRFVQIGTAMQAGFSMRGPSEFQDGFIGREWLAGPVRFDMAKQLVLHGIPFRGACGVMANGHLQIKSVGDYAMRFGARPIERIWKLSEFPEKIPGHEK